MVNNKHKSTLSDKINTQIDIREVDIVKSPPVVQFNPNESQVEIIISKHVNSTLKGLEPLLTRANPFYLFTCSSFPDFPFVFVVPSLFLLLSGATWTSRAWAVFFFFSSLGN